MHKLASLLILIPACSLALAEECDSEPKPTSVSEAIIRLDNCLSEEQKKQIADTDDADSLAYFHMGLGLWIRNSWGLWANSKLAQQFKTNGIDHADDMSALLLDLLRKYLVGQPLNLEESVSELRKGYMELARTVTVAPGVIREGEKPRSIPDPQYVVDKIIELN